MDVREKLVELLGNIYLPIMCGPDTIGEYRIPHKFKKEIASHLIAHGVTVQRWIPVTERLPQMGENVLCWYEYFRFGNYNRMFQTYGIGHYFRDGMWGGEVSNGHQTKVLAWMPLPEPPKGE